MSVRRSSRGAYKSLVELERRAKEAEAAAAGPLWGEDAFAEIEDDDASFDADGQSDDGEDIIDSDFDEPEEAPAADAGEQAEKTVLADERQAGRKAKSGKYVDPAMKAGRRASAGAGGRPLKKAKPEKAGRDGGAQRPSLRRSTKVASERAAKEREKRQQEDEERRRKRTLREAEKPEVRKLTQGELLEEAKETEVANRESLKELLRLEEEKKRLPPPKKMENGPVMSLRSRDGKQTVSFTLKETDARKAMFPQMYSNDGSKTPTTQ